MSITGGVRPANLPSDDLPRVDKESVREIGRIRLRFTTQVPRPGNRDEAPSVRRGGRVPPSRRDE
jgi:hypothetical protein